MKKSILKPFDIPILFIVFTREDTTKRVFERIRQQQPKTLYISSDGPRENKLGEKEKVLSLREYLINEIDWECNVKTLFHDTNLGCKYAPQTAISWFFKNEEMGVILEDDCLPSNSFFTYCSDLLIKYKNDLRVFGISGTNLQPELEIPNSYYFSEFFMTWGWASWRNRWLIHEEMLTDFETYLNDPLVLKKLKNKIANKELVHKAKISFEDKLDAWDYPWIFSCFANNALLVTPTKNLIQNIGFGEGATHTGGRTGKQIPENKISFPLIHPKILHANHKIDDFFFKRIFGWRTFLEKLTNKHYIFAAIKARFKK